MIEENPIIKRITIKYDNLEELFSREESMKKTLNNYLKRENNYEFYKSYIEQGETKFKLVLEIKLKDGNN